MSLLVAPHRGPLGGLAETWAELLDPAHPGAVFRSFAWQSAWWEAIPRGVEPLVLVATEGARTVGLLPCYARRTLLGGRSVRLMGDGIVGSDYLGVVARAPDEARAAGAFATYLGRGGFDEVFFDALLPHDPLARLVAHADLEHRFRCPYVRLDGDFASYLRARPEGAGEQWRRRLRWLEKRPGYAFEILERPDEVARGIELLLELHAARWSLEGGSEAIDGEPVLRFHRRAAQALAELGWARIFVLSAEGGARAVLYGFRHGDRFAYYQAGHDPAWRQRSVGTVVLGQAIEWCYAEGLAEFDFLHGMEPYKLNWATDFRDIVGARARGRGLRAVVGARGNHLFAGVRRAVGDALPPSVRQHWRHALRRWRHAY